MSPCPRCSAELQSRIGMMDELQSFCNLCGYFGAPVESTPSTQEQICPNCQLVFASDDLLMSHHIICQSSAGVSLESSHPSSPSSLPSSSAPPSISHELIPDEILKEYIGGGAWTYGCPWTFFIAPHEPRTNTEIVLASESQIVAITCTTEFPNSTTFGDFNRSLANDTAAAQTVAFLGTALCTDTVKDSMFRPDGGGPPRRTHFFVRPEDSETTPNVLVVMEMLVYDANPDIPLIDLIGDVNYRGFRLWFLVANSEYSPITLIIKHIDRIRMKSGYTKKYQTVGASDPQIIATLGDAEGEAAAQIGAKIADDVNKAVRQKNMLIVRNKIKWNKRKAASPFTTLLNMEIVNLTSYYNRIACYAVRCLKCWATPPLCVKCARKPSVLEHFDDETQLEMQEMALLPASEGTILEMRLNAITCNYTVMAESGLAGALRLVDPSIVFNPFNPRTLKICKAFGVSSVQRDRRNYFVRDPETQSLQFRFPVRSFATTSASQFATGESISKLIFPFRHNFLKLAVDRLSAIVDQRRRTKTASGFTVEIEPQHVHVVDDHNATADWFAAQIPAPLPAEFSSTERSETPRFDGPVYVPPPSFQPNVEQTIDPLFVAGEEISHTIEKLRLMNRYIKPHELAFVYEIMRKRAFSILPSLIMQPDATAPIRAAAMHLNGLHTKAQTAVIPIVPFFGGIYDHHSHYMAFFFMYLEQAGFNYSHRSAYHVLSGLFGGLHNPVANSLFSLGSLQFNVIIRGAAGFGKSWMMETIQNMSLPSACQTLTNFSPNALHSGTNQAGLICIDEAAAFDPAKRDFSDAQGVMDQLKTITTSGLLVRSRCVSQKKASGTEFNTVQVISRFSNAWFLAANQWMGSPGEISTQSRFRTIDVTANNERADKKSFSSNLADVRNFFDLVQTDVAGDYSDYMKRQQALHACAAQLIALGGLPVPNIDMFNICFQKVVEALNAIIPRRSLPPRVEDRGRKLAIISAINCAIYCVFSNPYTSPLVKWTLLPNGKYRLDTTPFVFQQLQHMAPYLFLPMSAAFSICTGMVFDELYNANFHNAMRELLVRRANLHNGKIPTSFMAQIEFNGELVPNPNYARIVISFAELRTILRDAVGFNDATVLHCLQYVRSTKVVVPQFNPLDPSAPPRVEETIIANIGFSSTSTHHSGEFDQLKTMTYIDICVNAIELVTSEYIMERLVKACCYEGTPARDILVENTVPGYPFLLQRYSMASIPGKPLTVGAQGINSDITSILAKATSFNQSSSAQKSLRKKKRVFHTDDVEEILCTKWLKDNLVFPNASADKLAKYTPRGIAERIKQGITVYGKITPVSHYPDSIINNIVPARRDVEPLEPSVPPSQPVARPLQPTESLIRAVHTYGHSSPFQRSSPSPSSSPTTSPSSSPRLSKAPAPFSPVSFHHLHTLSKSNKRQKTPSSSSSSQTHSQPIYASLQSSFSGGVVEPDL